MRTGRPSLALDTNLVQDELPAEVVPKLYIGSLHAAFALETLRNHNITHVSSLYLVGSISAITSIDT